MPVYDEILEVEIISSPLVTGGDSPAKVPESLLSCQSSSRQKFSTPITLGGSLFRRKAPVPTSDPSPVNTTAKLPVHFPSLGSQEPSMSTSEYDSQSSLLSRQTSYSAENSVHLSSSKMSFTARTSSGKTISIEKKPPWKAVIREQEKRAEARAQKEAYYGVDIHGLLNNIEDQPPQPFQPRSPCPLLVIAKKQTQ